MYNLFGLVCSIVARQLKVGACLRLPESCELQIQREDDCRRANGSSQPTPYYCSVRHTAADILPAKYGLMGVKPTAVAAERQGAGSSTLILRIAIGVHRTTIDCRYYCYTNLHYGAAVYQLGNTSSRTITEVKQR